MGCQYLLRCRPYGSGTASFPKKQVLLSFARAVAKRYRAGSPRTRSGTRPTPAASTTAAKYDGWIKLAALTKAASKAIRKVDRSAQIVAASSTVIPTPKFQTESFFFRYLRELKRQKAQFDAISVHLYPVNPRQGPDARVASIEAVRRVMRRVGLKKQLWDTEVNYGDRRTATNQVVLKPKRRRPTSRTHVLDSARYDLARTFWYGWDIDVLGSPRPAPTVAHPRRTGVPDDERLVVGTDVEGLPDLRGVTTCRVGNARVPVRVGQTDREAPRRRDDEVHAIGQVLAGTGVHQGVERAHPPVVRRVALMGTEGIPARYGGFETAIQHIGPGLVERGWT